ncbi:protein translocase subunit TIM13 [Aspergillus undulatus]|uniref:protein translocase subunit TIM13 n=1 Tax=Aspergillus undulatus TaxID=1810928 RepID=UPI003CCD7F8E
MALFGSSSSSGSSAPEAAEIKTNIIKQLQTEAAMANARQLIGKVNEHCFDACVPSPGSTMSAGESTCLSQCMEKYISLWNVASKSYLARLATERKNNGLDVVSANTLATGGPGADSL